MTRIRVFVLLALTLSGCMCDVSTGKDTKRAVKSEDYTSKKIEKKSTNEKRESSGVAAIYGFKAKDEPFRPIYQYQYQPTAVRYVAAAASPQVAYTKPENMIRVTDGVEGGNNQSPGNNEVIQYAPTNSYKPDGGIIYSPSSYKGSTNSGGVVQYASSAYRGPYVTNYQPAPVGIMKMHSPPLYTPQPPAGQPPAAVTLPLHYGGFEQQLPSQHHQQNQYAIAFPAEYLRHYQQNIATPFPLHGAHTSPIVFSVPPPQALAPLKDQPFKQSAVHYVLAPPSSPQTPSAPSSPAAAGPTVVTHFIPLYGAGSQQHQQFQQHSPRALYFGGHHQQAPAPTFGYAALPPQQQSIQIVPKNQIIGPIQMAAIGAGAAAATVPYIPYKAVLTGQQLQQPLHHFHQHLHPGATTYARYSPVLSDGNSIVSAGGGNNPADGSASEHNSGSSTLKLNPLYSSPTPPSSTGSLYSGSNGAAGGVKMSYTYATDAHSVGPVYTHPGAMQYGTHLYQAPSKVIEIGSNRVTAGSAAIAGVAPPAYHPQQKSAAGNSQSRSVVVGGSGAGGGGNSSPVVKFS